MARKFELQLGLDLSTLTAGLSGVASELTELATSAASSFSGVFDGGVQALQSFSQQLQQASQQAQQVAGSLVGLFQNVSQAASGDELADLQFDRVFGDASAAVEEFTTKLSSATGRTVGDLQAFIAQTKFAADGLGFTAEKSAELSQSVAQLALDFASFRGISDESAFSAIQQALIGNTRGLKQYGIVLDEAAEKQRALDLSFDPDNMTQQEQALVRLQLVTEALVPATGAAAQSQNTFSGSVRSLNSQLSEFAGEVGKITNDLLKPLVQSLRDAVIAVRAFASENPELFRTLVQVGTVIGGVIVGFTGLVTAAAAVFAPIAALLASIGSLGTTLTTIVGPLLGMGEGVGALSVAGGLAKAAAVALSSALLLVGAAIAGWEIGSWISDLLDFEGSIERATKGTATWVDHIKRAGVAIVTLGVSEAVIVDNQARIAASMQLTDESTKKLIATFAQGSEELETFNRLVEEGVSVARAAILASNKQNELLFLTEKGLKRTAAEEKRYQELLRQGKAVLADAARAEAERSAVTEVATRVREEAAKKEKDFLKSAAETTNELIRLRAGETAALIDKLRRENEETIQETKRAETEKTAEIARAMVQRAALQAKIATRAGTPEDVAQFARVEQDLKQHQSALAQIKDDQVNKEALFVDRFAALQRKQTEALVTERDKRIKAVQDESNKLISEYQKQVDKISAELDKLQAKRDGNIRDTKNLLAQINQAELEASNPIQAKIKAIAEERAAIIRKGGAEQDAQQVAEKTITQLRTLADQSKQIAALKKEEADALRAAGDASSRGDRAGVTAATEKTLAAAEAVIQLTQQQADAKAELERQEASLAAAVQEGATAQQDLEREILTQLDLRRNAENDILAIQQNQQTQINAIAKEYDLAAISAKKLGDELIRTADAAERIAKAQGQIKPVQNSAVTLTGDAAAAAPSTDNVAKAVTAQADAAKAAQGAAEAARASEGAAKFTATAAADASRASTQIGAALTAALAATTQALAALVTQGQELLNAANLFPDVAAALATINDQQAIFGKRLADFGGVVLEKFTETAAAFKTQGAAIADNTARLKAIDIAGAGDINLAASGLPAL